MGFRNLAARNRDWRNFRLMLFLADSFRGYALSCKRFSWLCTFVQTIFVAMHFCANDFRGYALSCESNFVDDDNARIKLCKNNSPKV